MKPASLMATTPRLADFVSSPSPLPSAPDLCIDAREASRQGGGIALSTRAQTPSMKYIGFLLTLLTLPVSLTAGELPEGYKLLYQQDFTQPKALADFVMTDPGAWRHATGDQGRGAIELHRQSQYEAKVRSPFNIALVADKVFGDFILEVEMKQTGKEYGHRDMCLFFGVQDPSNFYYSHIATQTDDHAHNVFIVKDAPRTKISTHTTQGVNWGLDVWHKVRLERKGGHVTVFFDDMTTPIMEAEDDRFGEGYLGFGSFDDVGQVTGLRVWGPAMKERPATFYGRWKE